MNLPTLSDKPWIRFVVFTAYYIMQGLPIGVVFIALPAWFTAQDVDKGLIASFVAIAGLPWALKLVVGLLIDRFTFRPMGLKRPWILGTQGFLLLVAASLWFITDLETQFWWLVAICTAMNVFAATEDVAVDGLAITIFPESERGRASCGDFADWLSFEFVVEHRRSSVRRSVSSSIDRSIDDRDDFDSRTDWGAHPSVVRW